jgi:hypothetical protein
MNESLVTVNLEPVAEADGRLPFSCDLGGRKLQGYIRTHDPEHAQALQAIAEHKKPENRTVNFSGVVPPRLSLPEHRVRELAAER